MACNGFCIVLILYNIVMVNEYFIGESMFIHWLTCEDEIFNVFCESKVYVTVIPLDPKIWDTSGCPAKPKLELSKKCACVSGVWISGEICL